MRKGRAGAVALAAGLLLAFPIGAAAQPVAPSADQRVVLVTGSTSGLGREVARSLAADGDHVIVHGRSEERGLALVDEINTDSPGSARFYRADFASLAEVRALAEAVLRDYDRLDVLVNNAGILPIRETQRRLSEDGHELTFQVNYLAGYLLTDLLLPLLRSSAPSRIVNVASVTTSSLDFDDVMLERGYSGMRAYGQSKLAQIMHAIDLAAAMEGTGVTANAVHPASQMDTPMITGAGVRPRSSVLEGRDNVLQLIDGEGVGSGRFYVDGRPGQPRVGQARDPDARARLRALSERLAGALSEGLIGGGR
ncbi:MAG: SDR family NAD(P)-dependent oxidoreductase [Gemmatimonadetes bacterium]|nr:SDR family NAD(P)-dependent oxidoreductase [Gemmatimonadota bacterium]